ncbi:MAG: hypothetical protein ACUVV4_06960 [Candidatus Bathyarchaeia archaeon]
MANVVIRTSIPMFIISIIAVLLLVEYFVALDPLAAFRKEMLTWGVIIYNFVMLLGSVLMLRYHTLRAMKPPSRDPKARYYSLIAIATFFIFLAIGYGMGLAGKEYVTMYMNTVIPATATLWGLNLIFSAMGVYRAMRITRLEGLALLIGGLSYFLKEMPIVCAIFPPMTYIGDWFLKYVMTPAARVAVLTAALISIVVCIRTIIQKERTALV